MLPFPMLTLDLNNSLKSIYTWKFGWNTCKNSVFVDSCCFSQNATNPFVKGYKGTLNIFGQKLNNLYLWANGHSGNSNKNRKLAMILADECTCENK